LEQRTQINDELNNLQDGNVALPPDANTTSRLEIVPVHDNMHGKVEGDGHPGHGSVADELSVAEQRGGSMMISVQEG
jgi:hypothetical protein